jgi:hypothetical protein
MPIMLLYSCCQIELTVRYLAAAGAFMRNVLGAAIAEQELVQDIRGFYPNREHDLEHFDVGEALFQVNAPTLRAIFGGQVLVHQAYLDRIGPCVTNLNYFVDDAVHAFDMLSGLGAAIHLEGPSSAARSLADYGPENTRPGADGRKFYFMGSRPLVGFDLEFMEPNFQRVTAQTAQVPFFMHPRPGSDGNLKLHRLRVVVPDLAETLANLVNIFAPACRSNPYRIRDGSMAQTMRIGLGGLELEYCQPRGGTLAGHLERYGPGVVTAEFGARDPNGILAKARANGLRVEQDDDEFGLNGQPAEDNRHWIGSRDVIGFDVILEPRERILAGG